MATKEEIIALNSEAAKATENYVQSLVAKAKNGQSLKMEEVDAIQDFYKRQELELEVNAIKNKHAQGQSLNPDDLAKLENYQRSITGESSIVPKNPQTKKLGNNIEGRQMTAQDKAFAMALGKIGPIANVPLNETGDTPTHRLADKIYGPDNWLIDTKNNQIKVRSKGQEQYFPLPIENMLPSLQRTGITTATGLSGDALGSLALLSGNPIVGVAGIAAGSSAGGAIGENINIKNAINDAKKLGVFKPEERQVFDDAVNQATITGGSLGLLFGGGLPVLKGVLKGGITKGLPKAIRTEDFSLAQEGIDNARKFSVGGKDFNKIRSTLNAEQLNDKLFNEFSNAPSGKAGTVTRDSANRFIQQNDNAANVRFNSAEAEVKRNLAQGKKVGLYDISGLWSRLQEKVLGGAADDEKPEVRKFLKALESNLNYTKKQIIAPEFPLSAKGEARKQFQNSIAIESPADATIFGPGSIKIGEKKIITPDFDPKKVTALDFKMAKNFIKDTLTKLENPKYILDKGTKKDATEFLHALEAPFAGNAGDAVDVSLANGFDPVDLGKSGTYKGIKTKVVGSDEAFNNIAQGYKIKQQGYKQLPVDIRKVIKNNPTDTMLEEQLMNFDPTYAKQVRTIVDKYATPDEKLGFSTSVKARIYNPSDTVGKQQIQRQTKDVLSSNVIEQGMSPEEMIKQGIRPSRALTEKALIPEGEKALAPTQTFYKADRVANTLSSPETRDTTAKILLGKDANPTLTQAQELAGYQKGAGMTTREQPNLTVPTAIRNLGSPSDKKTGLVGGAISDIGHLLGSVARPAAGMGADALEALKTATFAPAATVPNLGGYAVRNDLIGQPFKSEEERKRGLLSGLLGGF